MQQVDKNEADKSLQQRLHQQQKILIEIKKEFMPISQLLSRTNSNDFASSINTKIIRKILQQANSSNISIVANFNMSNFKLKENARNVGDLTRTRSRSRPTKKFKHYEFLFGFNLQC